MKSTDRVNQNSAARVPDATNVRKECCRGGAGLEILWQKLRQRKGAGDGSLVTG